VTATIRHNRRSLRSALLVIAHQVRSPPEIIKAVQQAWQLQTVAVSEDDPTRVSYARNRETRYDSKRRVSVKCTKFLARHFPAGTPARDYWAEVIGTRYADRVTTEDDFVRLTGDDIVTAYHEEIGGHSCMTGPDCEKVEFYALNPDRVSLLVFRNRARSLVWVADCGTILLDRVYAPSVADKDTIRRYAQGQGWTLREDDRPPFNGWSSGRSYRVSGLRVPSCRTLPWLDSLDNCSSLDVQYPPGRMAFETVDIFDCIRETGHALRCTEGGPFVDSIICGGCGDRFQDDDTTGGPDGESYCFDCYSRHFVYCERCCEDVEIDDARQTPSHGIYCDYCYDATHRECIECREDVHEDDLDDGPDGPVCSDCSC